MAVNNEVKRVDSGTFDFPEYDIPEHLIERIKRINFNNCYHIAITGTIGAGKTTRCAYLYQLMQKAGKNTKDYPEYLAMDEAASNLLKKRIDGVISPNTFQNYVCDIWDYNLKNKTDHDICIYERAPDDCLTCFANLANKNNEISDIDLLSMFNRMKSISITGNIPSYFDQSTHLSVMEANEIENNVTDILDIIENDISNGIYKRIIGLSVPYEVSIERISIRNRNGEENYPKKLIYEYNEHYTKLYNFMIKNKRLDRFVDLGLL